MTSEASPILTLEEVRFGFPRLPEFLGPVTLTVERGECWAIVGPNGAGKSTLLRLMAGLRSPHSGWVKLSGKDVTSISARHRAQQLSFVPQYPPGDLDLSARDVVLMGRFPHRSMGLFESREDYRIAERAMEITKITGVADRPLGTLSGGEAQRVHIAAAVAQQPEIMLFDEPTASLDLQHQLAIFRVLRDRAWRDGLAVVAVTHDVNLAARFCSHVVLLQRGKVVSCGRPEEVITPDVLGPVYGVALTTLSAESEAGHRWVVPVGDLREDPP